MHDFVERLDQLIDMEERESEAQLNIEGMDVVRLMTIHAAKGLEFPVVFVPELERPFNYGVGTSAYVDLVDFGEGKQPVVGLKGLLPAEQQGAAEDTVFRTHLQRLAREKTDAEMQRLLYVACTRAERHLMLSGDLSKKLPASSWLAWLLDVLPIQESLAQRALTITDAEQSFFEPQALTVPIRTSAAYAAARLQRRTVPEVSPIFASLLNQPSTSQVMSFGTGEPHGPEDIAGRVAALLNRNLRPVRGAENSYVRISPSTIHTLFLCARKYYYQQILNLPDDALEATNRDLDSPKILDFSAEQGMGGKERGILLHRLFEEGVFDREKPDHILINAANAVLDRMNVPTARRRAMDVETLILRTARHYRETGLQGLLAASPQVYREYAFALRIGQIEVSGTLDVLFWDAERQQWTILDYKSNEIAADEVEAEMTKHRYDIQMQLYALAVSRILNVENLDCLVFFTVPGVVYDAVDVSATARQSLIADIEHRIAAITGDRFDTLDDAQPPCAECAYHTYGQCP